MSSHVPDGFPCLGGPQPEDSSATSGDDNATVRQMGQPANPISVGVGERKHLFSLLHVPELDAGVPRAGHKSRTVERQALNAVVMRRVEIESAINVTSLYSSEHTVGKDCIITSA